MKNIYILVLVIMMLAAVAFGVFSVHSPAVKPSAEGTRFGKNAALASGTALSTGLTAAPVNLDLLRASNDHWLNRFSRSLLWDVQYTFTVHDCRAETTSERRFRSVYDRGLDFLPPSELALYCGPVPNEVLQDNTGKARVIICRWSSPRTIWQWPMASQYTVPSPLAQLHEFRRQQTQSVGALDAFFDPETGLLQRELFWGFTERSGKPQWFPSAMFVYEYKGESTPQQIFAYAGKQDILNSLPTDIHDCWDYTESLRQPELKFQYSWYGSVVDGLYFITRMDVNAYGTDKLIRTCEVTDIVISENADDHGLMREVLPGLSIYSQE